MLYWPGHKFLELKGVVNKSQFSLLLKQNSNYAISSIVVDSLSGETLLEGQLCPLKEDSARAHRQSVDDFVKAVIALDDKEDSDKDTANGEKAIIVTSSSGKELTITPVGINNQSLEYLYKGAKHTVDLDRLSASSVKAVKVYLGSLE